MGLDPLFLIFRVDVHVGLDPPPPVHMRPPEPDPLPPPCGRHNWMAPYHWRRFVKKLGGKPKYWGQKVVKSAKCMGGSQLLGACARAAPKVYAYATYHLR